MVIYAPGLIEEAVEGHNRMLQSDEAAAQQLGLVGRRQPGEHRTPGSEEMDKTVVAWDSHNRGVAAFRIPERMFVGDLRAKPLQ